MTLPLHKLSRYPWSASILFWQFSALIFLLHRFFTNMVDQMPVNWPAYIASMEALHLGWGILSVPVLNWLNTHKIQSFGKWILISIAVALIHSLLTTLLFSFFIMAGPGHLGLEGDEVVLRIVRYLVASPVISWIVSVLLLLAWYGWRVFVQYEEQRNKAAALQNELVSSQLQLLRMQLNPHFLFNAFNTISMMMRTGRLQEATTTLSRIADLFRNSVLRGGAQKVMLIEEISFCNQYLDIEAIRFSDRLKVNLIVDPDAEQCTVPNMILQPLVENAFKHGLMNQLEEVPVLEICARIHKKEQLIIQVKNTGHLKPQHHSEGIGLNNVRKRINLSYGDKARIDLYQDGTFVVAQVEITL